MFNLLVVDDEQKIIDSIKRIFQHIDGCNWFEALNANSAIEIMKSKNIDIVIIDYLLGEPYQGDELIKFIRAPLFMNGKYKDIPVILMTGTRGLKELRLSMVSLGVDYHLKREGVTSLLHKALSHLEPTKYSRPAEEAVDDPRYNYENVPWYDVTFPDYRSINLNECPVNQLDIAFIVATGVEVEQIARLFKPLKRTRYLYKITTGLETYFVGRFGAFNSVFVRCNMGSSGPQGSLLTTERLIGTWKPKVIVMVGIAFGRDINKQMPGDVLVATKLILYEIERRSCDKDIFRGEIPPSGLLLQNRFTNAYSWEFNRPDGTHVSVHPGAILSGEKLVDDPIFKKKLIDQHQQAIGGEMEGAGVYASAVSHKLDWIVVKGVADWGDGKKHKQFQKLAAAAACSLAHYVFSDSRSLEGIR